MVERTVPVVPRRVSRSNSLRETISTYIPTSPTSNARATKRNVVRIKVISIGAGGSGKSCLIKRFCEEKFVSRYISTIGVDYGVKAMKIRDKDVRVNFWDLSGYPEFFEVRNEFYKDTQGGILVYDATSRRSFEQLNAWVDEAAKYGARNVPFVVCGNKVDKRCQVSEEEGRAWARSQGYSFFETSANTGVNVNEVFARLFDEVLDQVLCQRPS